MAIDVKNLLQDIADAVEGHNVKAAALADAKAAYDAAAELYTEAGVALEKLRADLNTLLGTVQSNRVR